MTTWTCETLLALGLVTGCVAPAGLPATPPVVAAQAPLQMLMETPPGISVYDGSRVSPLSVKGPNPFNPAWTPDGRVVYVSGKQIWIDDQQVGTLPPQLQPLLPSMARDGTILFAAIGPDTGGPRRHLTASQPVTTQAALAAAPPTQLIVRVPLKP